MNIIKKRVFSFAILSALLLSFTACGENAEEVNYVASGVNKIFLAPTIPEDVRFDGMELHCYGMQTLVEGANGTEDAPVGAVSQELYDRNRRCEERFGVTLTFTNNQGTDFATVMPKAIRQSAQSGSNDFDVVFSTQSVCVPLINEGLFLPISEFDTWIDLEQPWWNKGYIESVSLNSNAQYALFGHITYNQVERTTAVFANVTKLNDQHNIKDKDIFELVLNGKWTLDKMTELVNMGYRDLNGNSKKDDGDMFGLVHNSEAYNWVAYSAGLEFTARNEEGYPVLNLNNERSVKLTEKMISLFFNNQNVYSLGNAEHLQHFGEGRALFVINRLYAAGWAQLREMRDDFVILPYPKFDDTIDGYHCAVENLVQWGCVSSTIDDDKLEMTSAVMEQICYDGYMNVTPIYYENDLKLKYSRGDDVDTQSKVIDIIVQGARTDFLFVNDIGGLKNIFRESALTGKNSFASYYDSRKVQAELALEAMIDKYEENM